MVQNTVLSASNNPVVQDKPANSCHVLDRNVKYSCTTSIRSGRTDGVNALPLNYDFHPACIMALYRRYHRDLRSMDHTNLLTQNQHYN
jgi:hypothetical protein